MRYLSLPLAALISFTPVSDAGAVMVQAVARTGAPVQVPGIPAGLSAPGMGGAASLGISHSGLGSTLVMPASLDAELRTRLSAPALDLRAALSVKAEAASAVSAPSIAASAPRRRAVAARVSRLQKAAIGDAKALEGASPQGSYSTARSGFDRLLGLFSRRAGGGVAPPAGDSAMGALSSPARAGLGKSILSMEGSAAADEVPAPVKKLDPAKRSLLRKYLAGTAAFKLGMEALGVSVPVIALTVFGQVKWAAVLGVGWGLSMIVFSSLAGGLLDRKSPTKIISWAMALQAGTVSVFLGLLAVDKFLPALVGFPLASPYVLLVLYSLAGGFLGAADTARQVIPAEVIGSDERQLKLFNAKTHMAYETAGVIGALLTGVVISAFGLLPALLMHPPAYLLAAFLFSRIKLGVRKAPAKNADELAEEAHSNAAAAGPGFLPHPVRRALGDLKTGAQVLFSRKMFIWGTVALTIPLVIHRLLEGLLVPVAATSFLGDPAAAAWMIGASNFGELMGATLLMRALMKSKNGTRFRTSFWVKLMALGVLGLWALNFAPTLLVVLPLIALCSMTWAASDLSLRSKLQNAIPNRFRGRAFGFLGALAFAMILASSLGIGMLMDAMAHDPVFFGVNLAFTALAALLFYASKALKKK